MFTASLDVSNFRDPLDARYMKVIRSFLRQLCAWPHEALGEPPKPSRYSHKHLMFCESLMGWFGGIVYVRNNFNEVSFLEMGQTYLTIFFSIVAAQRQSIPWFQVYHNMMKEFLQEVHLFHHKQKSEFCKQMHQRIHTICEIFTTFVVVEVFFGVFLFNVTPFYNNCSKGMFSGEIKPGKRFEQSIQYALPYINQRDSLKVYILQAIINILLSYDACVCFSCFDVTLCVIVFHIWGHLKIIDNKLKSIPLPGAMRERSAPAHHEDMSYSKEENRKVGVLLKEIIDHHRMVMRFLTKASEAFGPMLCLYCVFNQVSGCILLLECSDLDPKSLSRFGLLSISLFQLFIQISVIVELLGTQSETLKDVVYSIPWECMDTSNRKLVLFLLFKVQKPIRLKPIGIVSVGVQTMIAIFKTTFSYFMLLKTFD